MIKAPGLCPGLTSVAALRRTAPGRRHPCALDCGAWPVTRTALVVPGVLRPRAVTPEIALTAAGVPAHQSDHDREPGGNGHRDESAGDPLGAVDGERGAGGTGGPVADQ